MPLEKLLTFTNDVGDLANKPNATMTAEQLKAQFDAAPNEVRVYLNKLIDDLSSVVDGDSGADNIAVTAIAGLTGASVQAVLESLKTVVDSTVLGQIPDGSITEEKLAFEIATNAESVSIADVAGHFTGTNVEMVLAELFQFADSVHQDWTDVIGLPILKADTSAQKKSKTQTIKNDLATNLTAKGQTSVGTETLVNLVSKVANLGTAKFAKGTFTASTTNTTINNLTFTPDYVLIKDATNTTTFSFMLLDNKGVIVSSNNVMYTNSSASTLTNAARTTLTNVNIITNGFVHYAHILGTFNFIAVKE